MTAGSRAPGTERDIQRMEAFSDRVVAVAIRARPEGHLLALAQDRPRERRGRLVDRGLVTSRDPDDIPAFNRAMLEVLGQAGRQARSAA